MSEDAILEMPEPETHCSMCETGYHNVMHPTIPWVILWRKCACRSRLSVGLDGSVTIAWTPPPKAS